LFNFDATLGWEYHGLGVWNVQAAMVSITVNKNQYYDPIH